MKPIGAPRSWICRGYGRHQITAWQAQEQTRAYQEARVALLAGAQTTG